MSEENDKKPVDNKTFRKAELIFGVVFSVIITLSGFAWNQHAEAFKRVEN